jgi:hypothetical protein
LGGCAVRCRSGACRRGASGAGCEGWATGGRTFAAVLSDPYGGAEGYTGTSTAVVDESLGQITVSANCTGLEPNNTHLRYVVIVGQYPPWYEGGVYLGWVRADGGGRIKAKFVHPWSGPDPAWILVHRDDDALRALLGLYAPVS